jgi:hypothetical protein
MADALGGIVSRRDLIALGYAPTTIDRWVARGLLVRVCRGEYRVAGSGHPEAQEIAAMVWRAGPGAQLSGGLGLGLLGIKGFTTERSDHIAVPAPRRVTGVDFKVVSTVIPDCDKTRWQELPMLIPERLFIAAAATHRPARIRVGWDDAKFKGLVSLRVLRERTEALGRAYGAVEMRRIVPDLDKESEPERDFADIFRSGDPQPVPQVWVECRGRWYRLDFALLAARLALEYDGKNHDATRERDADRDLALKVLDIDTIRVTRPMLRNPEQTRRDILAVYRQRVSLGLAPIVPGTPPWPT